MSRHAAFILLVALGACRTSEPVRIGIVLDGEGVWGAQAAAEDINAKGGIRGRPVELRILQGHSGNLARVALSAAESLATDPAIVAVVGHTNSAASLAGAQVYNAHRVVQIAPTSTTPVYSSAGPWSFRLVASDEHQARWLAQYLLQEARGERVAVMYVNDDYGRALHAALSVHLAAAGLRFVHERPYLEQPDFDHVDEVAQALGRARPDHLVWIGREPELRMLLPRLRELQPKLRVLATDGFGAPKLGEPGGSALVGVRFPRLHDDARLGPAARHLRARYARTGTELSDQFYRSYEAVQLLAHAVETVGTERDAVRGYLAALGGERPPFVGILGPVVFDGNGDGRPSYHLVEVTRDGTRPVAPQLAAR